MQSLFAGVLRTLGENVIWASLVVVACGVVWRQALRPGWRRLKNAWKWVHDVLKLIDHELRHNGGTSMKDYAATSQREITRVNEQLNDLRRTQHATARVLDGIVDHQQFENDEIWRGLTALGIDRRKEEHR